jgi:hypothetical protein
VKKSPCEGRFFFIDTYTPPEQIQVNTRELLRIYGHVRVRVLYYISECVGIWLKSDNKKKDYLTCGIKKSAISLQRTKRIYALLGSNVKAIGTGKASNRARGGMVVDTKQARALLFFSG